MEGKIIFNFIGLFELQIWKESLRIKDKKIILYADRLVWEKDLRDLAEAYRIIISKKEDVVFVLAGDGHVRDKLKSMMSKTLFLGYKSGKELSTIYNSSDIFAFPSTIETFGNVTLEAMATWILNIGFLFLACGIRISISRICSLVSIV